MLVVERARARGMPTRADRTFVKVSFLRTPFFSRSVGLGPITSQITRCDRKTLNTRGWTKGATRRRLALFQPRARLDPGYPRSKWPLLLSPRWPSKAAAPASSPRCSSAPSGLISSTTCTPPWRYVQRAAISSDDDPRGRRGVPSPPLRTRHALLAPSFAAHRVFPLARPLDGVGRRVQTRWLTHLPSSRRVRSSPPKP